MHRRWTRHVRAAARGASTAFHRAIRKYGAESFTHELLERMSTEAGAKRAEQLWIAELGTFGGGYNETAGGEGCLGYRHTPAARESMSVAHSRLGPESYASGLVAASTPEARAKMAEKKRGRLPPSSPLAWAARRGLKHTPEAIEKMRAACTKRKRVAGRFVRG